jgi:chemotaxis protein MotB
MARKKKQEEAIPSTWLNTYADMITLCLCFFVILFNPDEVNPVQTQTIAAAMRTGGLGGLAGGLTLTSGRSADLGNTIMSLPSMEKGRSLGTALRKAVSVFSPEIRSNKVRVTHDERGLVITLAADAFFNPASARINIEQTRDILLRLGSFLASKDDNMGKRKFRIEGHTDSVDVDPEGPWEDNWQLSSERSRAVLRFLAAINEPGFEKRFQIAGFADTVPITTNDTPEGRMYNRRVDIIILDEGHL